jgi:hypothetical protein
MRQIKESIIRPLVLEDRRIAVCSRQKCLWQLIKLYRGRLIEIITLNPWMNEHTAPERRVRCIFLMRFWNVRDVVYG